MSEQLNLVSQVILTVLGGAITAITGIYVGLLLDKRHTKEKVRFDHFDQIKSKVLEPIKTKLGYYKGDYETNEAHRFNSKTYEKTMALPTHWWDYFSVSDTANPILLEDLPNHFKELPPLFDQVQNLVRSRTSEYLKIRTDVSMSLYEVFKECKTADGNSKLFAENELEMAAHAVMMTLMGYSRRTGLPWITLSQKEGRLISSCKLPRSTPLEEARSSQIYRVYFYRRSMML